VYDFQVASLKFEKNVVRYFPKFEIKWEVRYEGNTDWEYLASSTNKVYVTHRQPVLVQRLGHLEETKVFHTLIDIGCRNAEKSKVPTDIVPKIYGEFLDRIVKRVDGAGPIRYWGDPNIYVTPLIDPITGMFAIDPATGLPYPLPATCPWAVLKMIKSSFSDGTCGGWAAFFENCLAIQGIIKSKIIAPNYGYAINTLQYSRYETDYIECFGVIPDPVLCVPGISSGTIAANFYVKNWELLALEKFVVNDSENKLSSISPFEPLTSSGKIVRIREKGGLAGQGNDNPRSEFDNHAIVEFEDKLYDPSYGSMVSSSKLEWESSALAGMGLIFLRTELDPSTFMFRAEYFNWVEKLKDPTKLELNYD
jgi:hypothetical protein